MIDSEANYSIVKLHVLHAGNNILLNCKEPYYIFFRSMPYHDAVAAAAAAAAAVAAAAAIFFHSFTNDLHFADSFFLSDVKLPENPSSENSWRDPPSEIRFLPDSFEKKD